MLLSDITLAAAKRQGDALAFKCGSEKLAYSELEAASNQLAHCLLESGLTTGDRVGVFMPRTVRCAIAIYGIFKAGGIYVPIDPNLSTEGIGRLVADAEIHHLVSHQKKFPDVMKLIHAQPDWISIIGVSALERTSESAAANSPLFINWETVSQAPTHPVTLPTPLSPESPAYIMYSSGSTGRPKGITHSHRSGLAYARLTVSTYGVTPADVIGSHSPINFDMSTFGYFAGPFSGATTILIPEAYTKVPASLAKLIADEQITTWYSVPLALIQLIERGNLTKLDFPHIRWVIFAGEPFPPKYLRVIMRQWPNAQFSNAYGPTEVNVCTYYHLPRDYVSSSGDAPIPIGQTWAETEDCIIDEEDRATPRGQVGELCISSSTMMTGYWGRPELSAQALLHRSTPSQPSQTYYRTGDLVRLRPDGLLDFLGRKDRQIKIRGYRIELEEVEHALNQHPAIQEAGVFWIPTRDAKEIQAALQMRGASPLDATQLRTDLAKTLSPYAIPTRFFAVLDFPRTSSGKIDRKKLRDSLA